jgi:hypothetical protein
MLDPTSLERLLTPAEAARLMGISINTLAWWRRVGKGPKFHRVGRHARYAPSDLRAFVAAAAVETADSAKAARR